MLEIKVEEYLIKKVKELGGHVRKVQWIGRRGAPDRMVMLNGRTVFVELKKPKKTAEEHQAREHDRMRNHGGLHVEVVDTLQRVDALLAWMA